MLALAGCTNGVDYGPIPHSLYVADPRCDPPPGAAPADPALPYFVATSRLPDCRTPAVTLSSRRGDRLRFAMAGAPPDRPGEKAPADSVVPLALRAEADWWGALAAAAAAQHGRVLLYVHGFNESFVSSIRDTAQIARLTGFEGPVVHYAWPSRDSLLSYVVDETNTGWDERRFGAFLEALAQQPAVREIVLVTHSMGARLALPAVERIDRANPRGDAGRIANIILASPDIDTATFERGLAETLLTPGRVASGRRITVYASRHDRALAAARGLHGYPRLGSPYCFDPFAAQALMAAGLPPRCYPLATPFAPATPPGGLTVIDTSAVSHGRAGHADYLHSAPACRDFRAVVRGGGGAGDAEPDAANRQPTHLPYVFALAPDPTAKGRDRAICMAP